MTYNIIEKKTKEIIYTTEGEKATLELLACLWNKHVVKNKNIKQAYSHNYADIQKIVFTNDKYIYEFLNIPTSWGILDTNKIKMEGGEK